MFTSVTLSILTFNLWVKVMKWANFSLTKKLDENKEVC